MKALKLTILCCIGFAILGAAGGLFRYWQDWPSVAALTMLGIFLGAVAAPHFDPGVFPFPTLQQTIAGALAGIIIGALGSGTILALVVGAAIGSLVGGTSRFWIEKISFP